MGNGMGAPVCTASDPLGKDSVVLPNGTIGRLHTAELRADNRTPEERAASERAFQRELICQDGVLGAIACNRPFLELDGFEAGASAGGWGTGVSTDGTAAGTQWGGASRTTAAGFGVYAGVCVKVKGAKKYNHSASVGGSLGYGYGSVDPLNQSACIGGQFPPGASAFGSVK